MDIDLYSGRWRDEVIRLTDEVFGKGYYACPEVLTSPPGSVMLVCHEDNETLIGMAQGQVLPAGGLGDFLERRVAEIPEDIADADAAGVLGLIQAIAVAPGHRGRRIGTSLIEVLHDRLVGLGADKLMVSFKKGRAEPAVDRMMGRLGFDVWTRLPSYWRDRCESGEFECAERRNGCTCEALLYRKAVY